MNHFNYKHYYYCEKNIRLDYLQHRNDSEQRFFENEKCLIFYLGNILFLEEMFNTTKQILKIYNKNDDLVNKIESGRFIIVIFDKKKKKLTIVNDRFGLIPLYIYNDGYNIIISTEPKGIIKSFLIGKKKLKLDYSALANYFFYGYYLGNKYILKDIRKVKSASKIEIKEFIVKSNQYWKINLKFNKKINNEMLDKLLIKFKEGISKNMEKYKGQYFCDISGGYDCRFIFLNSNVNHVLTIGEPNCNEYKYVKETLKIKHANLINVKSKLTKKNLISLSKILDLSGNIGYPQVIDIINKLNNENFEFDYHYDGFLGDAIFGGSYLNSKKELFREFGINQKYDINDFNIFDFNKNILDDCFFCRLKKENDINNYINKEILNDLSNDKIKIKLLEFKFYNRGINLINTCGSLLIYKYVNNFFPYFYYPFFDLYSKIKLDDLHDKKVHTLLFKKLNKKYLRLKDDLFIVDFSYPYKFRLIISYFYPIIKKLFKKREKKIYDFSKDFTTNIDIINWFKNNLAQKNYIKFFNQKYIKYIFKDKNMLKNNYMYLNRCIGFVLFLKKYENKIEL